LGWLLQEHGVDKNAWKGKDNLNVPMSKEDVKKLQEAVKGYRSAEENKKRLQAALRKYEGTNFYHNFTRGIAPTQGQAQ
jgi:tRNA U38,U39,U40 pseudouridine synthase TruA